MQVEYRLGFCVVRGARFLKNNIALHVSQLGSTHYAARKDRLDQQHQVTRIDVFWLSQIGSTPYAARKERLDQQLRVTATERTPLNSLFDQPPPPSAPYAQPRPGPILTLLASPARSKPTPRGPSLRARAGQVASDAIGAALLVLLLIAYCVAGSAAVVTGAHDPAAAASLVPMLGKLTQQALLSSVVGGLFTLSVSKLPYVAPPVVSLADYTPLSVVCGYLGGWGLILLKLAWRIAVLLPAADATAGDAAALATAGALAAPAIALGLALFACARRGVQPTRGVLPVSARPPVRPTTARALEVRAGRARGRPLAHRARAAPGPRAGAAPPEAWAAPGLATVARCCSAVAVTAHHRPRCIVDA